MKSVLHKEIEAVVYAEIPGMKRVSSGGTVTTEQIEEKLKTYDSVAVLYHSRAWTAQACK